MGKYALSEPAVSWNSEGFLMTDGRTHGGSSGGISTNEEHRLLIIDDDEIYLRSIANYLRRRVSVVFTAKNLRDAETVLERHRINEVVCDYDLGEGHPDGVRVIQSLRRRYPGIRRAVICSSSSIDHILPATGIDDVMDKTRDLHRLRLLVQQRFD
jgi:DNA-binding NtrC family response regulator